MRPDAFLCACCQEVRSRNDQYGETWYGDGVCDSCVDAGVVEQCSNCGRYVEEKNATPDNSGDWMCPECARKVTTCDHCQKPVPDDRWAGSHLQRGPGLRPYLRCPRCARGNRTKVRKHPAVLGAEALDREAEERARREA